MSVDRRPQPRDVAARAAPVNVRNAYGWLLLLLAAVLLVKSMCGPLVLGVVSYPISESLESQLMGLELVTALVVVPWAAAAAVCALRARPFAPLLGFAPAAYTTYMFVQYVLGPEYTRHSLTSLVDLAILVLAGGLMMWSWSLSRAARLPRFDDRRRTRAATVLMGLAVFVVLRYAGALAGSISGDEIDPEFAEERTFFWSIFLLDLGVVVPCTLMAAFGLMRGRAAGQRGLYAVVGWFALVPPSVAAMAIVMWIRDDPHSSLRTVLLLTAASVAFAAYAAHVLHALIRTHHIETYERKDR